jgi:hypothetical protein
MFNGKVVGAANALAAGWVSGLLLRWGCPYEWVGSVYMAQIWLASIGLMTHAV